MAKILQKTEVQKTEVQKTEVQKTDTPVKRVLPDLTYMLGQGKGSGAKPKVLKYAEGFVKVNSGDAQYFIMHITDSYSLTKARAELQKANKSGRYDVHFASRIMGKDVDGVCVAGDVMVYTDRAHKE